jgi:hypothetical protein
VALIVAVLALIGIVIVVLAAITLASSWRRAQAPGQEPVDPARVEREVYDKLYGARSREVEVAEVSRPEPEPQRRPRAKSGIGAKRPASGEASH